MTPLANAPLNILVMHAEPVMAVGLVAALRQQRGFEVFVHGTDILCDGRQAIDVVVADHTGVMAVLRSRRTPAGGPLAAAKLLVLSCSEDDLDILLALRHGAQGYLLPGSSLDELAHGVRALAGGARYLCHAAAQRLADRLVQQTAHVTPT